MEFRELRGGWRVELHEITSDYYVWYVNVGGGRFLDRDGCVGYERAIERYDALVAKWDRKLKVL